MVPEPEASDEHSEEDTTERNEESDSGGDVCADPEISECSETASDVEASLPQKRIKMPSH